jgi:hypothetical protein
MNQADENDLNWSLVDVINDNNKEFVLILSSEFKRVNLFIRDPGGIHSKQGKEKLKDFFSSGERIIAINGLLNSIYQDNLFPAPLIGWCSLPMMISTYEDSPGPPRAVIFYERGKYIKSCSFEHTITDFEVEKC